MIEKLKNKYNIKILIGGLVVFIAIISVIVGLTYAFFTAEVEGNEDASPMEITTATLKLLFTDTQELKMPNALPGASVSKTFTIENIGRAAASYNIVIVDVSTNFQGNDLVYTLTSTNGGATKEVTVLPNTDDTIVTNVTIPEHTTQTYTFKVTFLETGENQDINQGKSYTGKLQVLPVVSSVAIAGRVKYANGDPVAGKTVKVESDPITTTTNANGYYEFTNVPIGNHTVSIIDGERTLASKAITLSLGTETIVQGENRVVVESIRTKLLNFTLNGDGGIDLEVESPSLLLSATGGVLYIGGDDEEITVSNTTGGILSCESSLSSSATCRIVGNKLYVTPVAAGNGTITIIESGSMASSTYTFEVTESTVTLAPNSGTLYVGGSNVTSTISGTNMGTLYCGTTDDQKATCSVSGTTLTIIPGTTSGDVVITVREGNGNKTATYNASIILPAISLGSTGGTLYVGGDNKTVTISGTNMGTLRCSSSNQNAATCTISGNILTIIPGTIAGESTITVIEGNGNQSKSYSASVLSTSINLSSASGTIYVGGSNITSTISGTNMGTLSCGSTNSNVASCSINGTSLTITPGTTGGVAAITVREGNGNKTVTYNANVLVVTLNLSTYSGTITLNETNAVTRASGTNIGSPLTCTPTNSNIVSCKVSSNVITITGKTSGSTTVVIREPNAGKTATYNISVIEPEPEEVYASWCRVELDVPYISNSERSGESFEEIIENFCIETCRDETGSMCWSAGGSNPNFYNGVWDSYCSWGGNSYYVECGAAD